MGCRIRVALASGALAASVAAVHRLGLGVRTYSQSGCWRFESAQAHCIHAGQRAADVMARDVKPRVVAVLVAHAPPAAQVWGGSTAGGPRGKSGCRQTTGPRFRRSSATGPIRVADAPVPWGARAVQRHPPSWNGAHRGTGEAAQGFPATQDGFAALENCHVTVQQPVLVALNDTRRSPGSAECEPDEEPDEHGRKQRRPNQVPRAELRCWCQMPTVRSTSGSPSIEVHGHEVAPHNDRAVQS